MTTDAGPSARSDTAEAAKEEVTLLLDLAIRRARGNLFASEEVKDLICGVLEEGKREILLIEERRERVGLGIVHGGKGIARVQAGGTAG